MWLLFLLYYSIYMCLVICSIHKHIQLCILMHVLWCLCMTYSAPCSPYISVHLYMCLAMLSNSPLSLHDLLCLLYDLFCSLCSMPDQFYSPLSFHDLLCLLYNLFYSFTLYAWPVLRSTVLAWSVISLI